MNEYRSREIPVHSHESVDVFLNGRLKLIQSRYGYRFSVDAFLLSSFATIKKGDTVVDLGTGCGIIPLLLLASAPVNLAVGLEIQEELADQAARNAALNGFARRMKVIRGDLRFPPLSPQCADVVLCNPPYRRARSGRPNPDPRKAIARHEILATPNHILAAGARLLRPRGRLAVIYPSTRLVEVTAGMRRFNLEPKRIRMVHPHQEAPAKLALLEAWLGARPGVDILPPVFGQGDLAA